MTINNDLSSFDDTDRDVSSSDPDLIIPGSDPDPTIPGVHTVDILPDGIRREVFTDKSGNEGVILRGEKGHFQKGTRPGNMINSSALARSMAYRRIEAGKVAAARGLRAAAEKSGRIMPGQGTGAAWAACVESVASALFDADKLSGQSEVLRALGQAVGIIPTGGRLLDDLGEVSGGLPDLLGASGADIDTLRLVILELKRSDT